MKPKNLSKKIRRLEARLQKGAKKLAKLFSANFKAYEGGASAEVRAASPSTASRAGAGVFLGRKSAPGR